MPPRRRMARARPDVLAGVATRRCVAPSCCAARRNSMPTTTTAIAASENVTNHRFAAVTASTTAPGIRAWYAGPVRAGPRAPRGGSAAGSCSGNLDRGARRRAAAAAPGAATSSSAARAAARSLARASASSRSSASASTAGSSGRVSIVRIGPSSPSLRCSDGPMTASLSFSPGQHAGDLDRDVDAGLVAAEPDHALGQLVDVDLLAHLEREDVAPGGGGGRGHHELHRFVGAHEVAGHPLVGDGDRPAVGDLALERAGSRCRGSRARCRSAPSSTTRRRARWRARSARRPTSTPPSRRSGARPCRSRCTRGG